MKKIPLKYPYDDTESNENPYDATNPLQNPCDGTNPFHSTWNEEWAKILARSAGTHIVVEGLGRTGFLDLAPDT
jgi:hypothetical protein